MKRALIILAIALVAGAAVYFFFFRRTNKAPEWKTAKVERGDISVKITATGALSAVRTVQVGAQVSGIVSKIFVDFDSVVRKGQVIALLDTTLLHASMRDAAASVERASGQAELMRRQFARTEMLFKEKVAAQADYDLAYANYKTAQAELKAAKATLDHEQIMLRYATIKAPINGTVISRSVDVGQTVISSFNAPTLFTIANDLKQMQVLANVDEADIGQVKEGQQTEFTVDAYPYEVFRGVVAQIRLQPVLVQNVNNYVVVINVANPELKLLPGLTATVTIKSQEHGNILHIPATALHFIPAIEYLATLNLSDTLTRQLQKKKTGGNEIPKPGSECFVWVKHKDKLQPVMVSTGLFDGANIEVAGNLNEGDEIVTATSSKAAAKSPTANNPFMPQMRPRTR